MAAAYCFAVAPFLEPPKKQRRIDDEPAASQVAPGAKGEFADLFAADEWQNDDPFTLKTERGTVLFQDYKMGANGIVTVTKVSLVIAGAPSANGPGRTYVVDAPDGAELKFENGLDLSKNSSGFGKLLYAKLRGLVTITSSATAEGAQDEIHLETRGIQIDQTSINTAQFVHMQFGPHRFEGHDLKLSFLNPEQKLKTTGMDRIAFSDLEITQVDLVEFYVADSGMDLFGDSPKPKTAAPVTGEATPIEIRCQGRFKIDFLTMEASFKDQVEVLRIPVRGQADSLRCDVLALNFDNRSGAASGKNRLSSKFAPVKLTATGHPVVLSSPSADVEAKCEKMEYFIDSRKIVLEAEKQVVLTRGTSKFKAPYIEYTLAKNPRRLGRLHAKGRGEMTAVDPRTPSRSIRGEWDQELKLEPEGALHRLEMRSSAGLFLAGDQHRFTAREMKLWLEESGPQERVARTKSAKSSPPNRRASWQEGAASKSAASPMLFDVRPRRMLAIGSVEANTPELQGHTQRMEVVFNYPAEEQTPQDSGSGPAPPPKKKAPQDDEPPEAKYDLVGDFIKVELDNHKNEEPFVREVTVHKNLRFERFDLTDPSAPPLRISGDQFKLTGGIRGDAEVVISGSPAEVSAEGVSIEGPEIHLQQRRNRIYIEQPGNLKITELKSVLEASGQTSKEFPLGQSVTPKLITVNWQGRMEFDGKKIEFKDHVVTGLLLADQEGIENEVEIQSGVMEIYLTRPVAFGATSSLLVENRGEPLGLDRLIFDGGVDVTNDAFDANDRRTAFDQLHAKNLSYDHLSGGFKSDGPGYVSSVRKEFASSALQLPGSKVNTVSKGDNAARKSGLSYIRVDFDGAITGNLLKRDLTFERRVNAVYSPVDAWDSIVDPNRRGGLGEQGIALRSEELSIFQAPGGSTEEANFEFAATGNVMVEGSQFVAYGANAKYAPAKKLVILEGTQRKDCEVHKLDEYGELEVKTPARRMTYRTDNKTIQIQEAGLTVINETPRMNFPKTGGARPQGQTPSKPGPPKPNIYRPGQPR